MHSKYFTMKHSLLACIVLLFSSGLTQRIEAQELTDSENYPVVYLRGTMTDWGTNDAYKFVRSGNVFKLEVSSNNPIPANSKFKLGDADWKYFDFGGASELDILTADSNVLELITTGSNLKTSEELNSGSITFEYSTDNKPSRLTVTFDFPNFKNKQATLPIMYINVYTDESHTSLNDEIIDRNLAHKNYFSNAEYWLDLNGCEWLEELGAKSIGSSDSPLPLEIKARGNYTRTGFSKKPFKLKLGKKQDLLALTPEKSKHYALLAHADDTYGYLRNFTMFNLGHRIGLPWTPSQQPVELYINGDYRGLYFLTESIRVGDGRVLIEELDDNVEDSELVSGGYIVELDNYDEPENQIRMDELSCSPTHHWTDKLRITFDTPEVYSDLQRRFVTDQFTAMNQAIGTNSNDTWKYLDLDDAARYYVVMEILSHTESYHGSTYLFRDRGEGQKWHFSPLWDGGNAFSGHNNNFFYECDPFGNTWIPSMRENAMFNDKVQKTWLWFMSSQIDGLMDDIDEYVSSIASAARRDHSRWGSAQLPDTDNRTPVADNSDIQSRSQSALSKLTSKIEWLKSIEEFGNFEGAVFSEPERDLTEAAPLPEYAITGLEGIVADASGLPKEYYNLQGMKITNPARGQMYIVRQGNDTFKEIY